MFESHSHSFNVGAVLPLCVTPGLLRCQEAKAKAQALARALGAAAGPGGGERVDAEGEKLSKRFSMMMAASGCKNLRDLVHKVCTQTDTHVHLQGTRPAAPGLARCKRIAASLLTAEQLSLCIPRPRLLG